MTLSRDGIVEASLLKPTKEKHGASPTPKEEAITLGKEPESSKTPKTTPLLKCPEIPEPPERSEWIDAQLAESTEWTDTLSTSSSVPQPGHHLPIRQRNPREKLELTQTKQVRGSIPTCRRMKEYKNGGGSSYLFFVLRMSTLVMSKSKGWKLMHVNRHSLWLSKRTSKMHGPPDDPKWGWHHWGLPLETHQRGMQNFPHTGGGSWAARGPRFSPRIPRNPWAGRTNQAD